MTKKDNSAKIQDRDGNAWIYSDIVKDHFFNPRNILKKGEEDDFDYDGVGRVGSPACGDEMVIWIKVDNKTKKITDLRWQTFGCGSAIASTSVLSEMVLEGDGMTIDQAGQITAKQITERLGGLPPRKIHCSVLGDQALKKAIEDYQKK